MKKVLLIDDHPLLREGLGRLIASDPGLEICGMAATAQKALALLDSAQPDLVITDLTLPGISGLELIQTLVMSRPGLPVMVLSMHDEMTHAKAALQAGASGYVMKDTSPGRLIEAIHAVLAGRTVVNPAVSTELLPAFTRGGSSAGALDGLSAREFEVFTWIGHSKPNREIAERLAISPRTVNAHRAHIRHKLGLRSGSELTRRAIAWVAGHSTPQS